MTTVGADAAVAVLDALARIDRDRYAIVGIVLRVDGPTTAIGTVYAIDRLEHSIAQQADIAELGQSRPWYLHRWRRVRYRGCAGGCKTLSVEVATYVLAAAESIRRE